MLRSIAKLLRITISAVLIVAGVTFAVSNRTPVELTFFPLPYSLSVPMFVVAIVLFSAGALTAWLICRISGMKERMLHRKTTKRMLALENEIAALRSEKLVTPITPPVALVK